MAGKALIIALFPYLFLESETEVRIDDLSFKSPYESVLKAEDKETRDALLAVRKCFRASRTAEFPVSYWSYSILNVSNQQEFDDIVKRVSRVADILRFIKLSSDQNHSHYSNFNYWVFQLNPPFKLDGEYAYVEAFLNGLTRNSFNMKKGVVVNPYLPQENLSPQPIHKNELENNKRFNCLYVSHSFLFKEPIARQKVLRAIEWFNRSFSHGERGVDLSEAVTNMHSALEALLRPHQKGPGNVHAELKAALLTLLGQRNQISDWFESFFSLRNSLVHGDVEPKSFLYRENRNHLLLARRVFLACLDGILHCAAELPLSGFEQEVTPNKVRIDEVIASLKSARKKSWTEIADEGLLWPLSGLRNDDITSPKDKVVEIGRLLLPYVRQELDSCTKASYKDIVARIDDIVNWSSPDLSLLALAYSNLEESYHLPYFDQNKTTTQSSLRIPTFSFISYAAWRLLVFFG